jgi:tetratricopeptide (TPR) repeat protein
MSEEAEWVLINLDEKLARQKGLPARLPVPRQQFEGLADAGLKVDLVRSWIKDFLNNSEAGKSGAWRKQNSQWVSSLEAFIDKAPLWEKAQKAFAESDFEKAVSALKRITTMDPDDHAARMNLASAYANARLYPEALKAFQAVRKSFAGDPDYHVAVAHLHLALKDDDKALEELLLALEAKPDCQPALDAMVQMKVLTPIYENPRDAASLTYVRSDAVLEYLAAEWDREARDAAFFLEQLAYHEREQRYDVALAAAERALAASGTQPGPERAELARVAALRALGRNGEAMAAVRAYAEAAPSSGGAQVELSRCLAAAGDGDGARAAIDRALELDAGDQSALAARFWPADRGDIQRVNEALPALRAFADAHEGTAGAWRSLARAMLIVGRNDEAIELFAKAVSLKPADDDLRAEYWSELGKAARFDEILADAGRITDMNKRDWQLRWNEAEAFLGAGKRVEARAAFSAINFDDSLHVDVRKRAKRAVKSLDETPSS